MFLYKSGYASLKQAYERYFDFNTKEIIQSQNTIKSKPS